MTTRRLTLLVLLALGGASCTCQDPDPGPPDGGRDGGADGGSLDAWAALREFRAGLRSSADHRLARADQVVASRDPARIFQFVRDEIATYPPQTDGFAQATSARRWGLKGTLRGGAGTPREKAELLVNLFERAGFTASVVQGTLAPSRVDAGTLLFRDTFKPFTFTPSASEAARWRGAIGGDPLPRSAVDPSGTEAAALAATLEALTPGTLTAPFDMVLGPMPLVRVSLDGGQVYANPLVPDAGLGDPVTVATPTPTGAAGSIPRVRVTVEGARADDPYALFQILDATYDMEEVIGRRVQLSFVPPGPLERTMVTPIRDLTAVVPVLSVVGPDVTQEERVDLATVGDLITFGGDVYRLTEDGGVALEGSPPLGGGGDPSRVASVEVSASGSAFPQVSVELAALDGAGQSVSGLPASSFTVTEDGVPVSFTLQRNQLDPRVVLLFDLSGSIPDEFRGPGAVSLAAQIISDLYAVAPRSQVRVAYINFGATFVSSQWATTATEAQGQASALSSISGGSELWEALLDVNEVDPTAIIMITDGDATDTSTPRIAAAIAAGPPVLAIGVGPVRSEPLDELARLSGGRTVLATMASTAIAAAAAELEARIRTEYRLSYRARAAGAPTRQVQVTVNARAGTDAYQVPTMPAPEPALSGLYLTIAVGGTSRRVTLAGFDRGFSTAFPTVTAAMKEDVRATLRGRVSISVEGAAPAPSIVMEEWITERLSLQPLVDAVGAGDGPAVRAALEAGVTLSPGKLLLAQSARLPRAVEADSLTFETSARVASMVEKVFEGGPVKRQLDLFPLGRWATAAADPRRAWQRTFAATAGLAVVEAQMFAGPSTQEVLAGTPLTYLPPTEARDQAGLTADEALRWTGLVEDFGSEYRLLAPLRPGAFWAIHAPSGSLIGVLPDGTGGGAEDACQTFDLANAYAQMIGLLGGLFNVPGLGAWVALAQWEIKYVTVATVVIGGGGTAVDLTNPGAEMACGMFNEIMGNVFPKFGVGDNIVGTWNTVQPDRQLPTLCTNPVLGNNTGPCG